ncbi:MAG: serine hydrolase domain-containing protein [Planctomycetota bacterium]|jgi:CubicO group peptidase (beta-lactamase class C family)
MQSIRLSDRRFSILALSLVLATWAPALAQEEKAGQSPSSPPSETYFPGLRDDWQRKPPAELGMDAKALDAAIEFAKANYNRNGGYSAAREPYNETIGPTKAPSGMNGIILRHGYIVAEWGDTQAVDMTFSVTKTYLSTVAGLALEAGLIEDLQDPVRDYVQDGSFDAAHNRDITWHQLLNQSSGWEGTLWEKPDWADRYRRERRPSEAPGEHYRYNDVRVNLLALCLLNVWRRPLPQVLREHVMDPIGASPTWRWHGYRNSWVNVDGLQMQSVSGGGHWGGGMFISSRDHARFGYLFLREGEWKGRQLISKDWIERARTPSKLSPTYGYMNWFLNTEQGKRFPSAGLGHVFFLGAGTNMIWLDPDHDMVVVVRWLRTGEVDAFIQRVLAAFGDSKKGKKRLH